MKITLSSILLFALIIPFIMTYSLSPIPGETPYYIFSLIFLGITGYIVCDLFPLYKYSKEIKLSLLCLVIALVLGTAFTSTIIARHNTAPIYQVHDIVLQQEAAVRYLVVGKNPYKETYFGTPMEQWNYGKEVNPALYHFVMEPLYLLIAVPFYYIANHTIGYFDARIPLYLLFFCLLFFAFKVPKEFDRKLSFVILLAFNPAMLSYIYEGRSDMFMFPILFMGFYLLYKEKYTFSSIIIACAFLIKQSAWPLFPLYVAYLYYKKRSIKYLAYFAITFLLGTVPFLFWNTQAYIDSTILYLSGSGTHSYPISGYGFSMLLHELGIIKDVHAYYPFIIWQVIIGIPILIGMTIYLKKHKNIQVLWILYGLFLFVYWYLSRYMNNSHFGYLTMVFITAYFWPTDEKKPSS